MEDTIEFNNFKITFGNDIILEGINLTLPLKGITVLTGRSGSGKTTMLRAINRLNEIDEKHKSEGEVSIHTKGKNINIYDIGGSEIHQLRRTVGMVFQHPNPLPLSIEKNIVLPVSLVLKKNNREMEQITEKVLKQVSLWNEVGNDLSKQATKLSGGQQQRLCLARVLALEPAILLLDEPTASLDAKATEFIETLIKRLAEQYPVIMVSHNMSQAVRLGDRFVILRDGKVVSVMNKDELNNGNANPIVCKNKLESLI